MAWPRVVGWWLDGAKCLNSGCVLKVGLTGLADRLDVVYKRKEDVKRDSDGGSSGTEWRVVEGERGPGRVGP